MAHVSRRSLKIELVQQHRELDFGEIISLLFFFQAEDGIRDRTVSGVQTCALPIYPVPVKVTDADATAPPYEGLVLDRSTGGLCLSVPETVEPGTILSVLPAHAPDEL